MTDKIPAMERIVVQVDKLHSSPHVACKVLSMMRRNDFDIRKLTELLQADPALTTFILKLVNSSYFGFSQSVSSLHQAVTLLGSRTLRLAVLSFGLIKQLNDNTPAQICERYWPRGIAAIPKCSPRPFLGTTELFHIGSGISGRQDREN